MTDATLLALSAAALARLVNEAFKSYAGLLELSRSPLAGSSLVAPALVLDEVAPTADDRGRALRVVLRWAVNRLAPMPPRYPLGQPRPFDDPTWTDPLWWGYNILRHRYLEPLRPDDLDDLGSSGLTEALAALTGISHSDRLFDERDRAVHEVAAVLREQLSTHEGDGDLRRMAVEELDQSLKPHAAARRLLGLAAVFRGVFPRGLLLEMAAAERLPNAADALDDLLDRRFLVEGDEGTNLVLPPALQEFVQARQGRQDLVRRHGHAAQFYLHRDQPLRAVWHMQRSGQSAEAAALLIGAASSLIEAWQMEELREALLGFAERDLTPSRWCEVQILLSDLLRKSGDRDGALAACRRALKKADEPLQQARLYHRLGKLYEDHNQMHALGYYQQAAERFPPAAPDLAELLTDQAWLHIHRREWAEAEANLTAALDRVAPTAWRQRASIYDALASLHRQQGLFEQAIRNAQRALFLREEHGDVAQVADSYNNLGPLYAEMGEFGHALESFGEALGIFRQLGNSEAIATVLLNMGGTLYYAGRLSEAIERYQESLGLFQQISLPRGVAQARYNLAEAFADLGQAEEACQHWRLGYALSQQTGLEDQVAWFVSLRGKAAALRGIEEAVEANKREGESAPAQPQPELLPEERVALEIARRYGWVTARMLVGQAHVSKATATRKLSHLAGRGLLTRAGRGRATCYTLPET